MRCAGSAARQAASARAAIALVAACLACGRALAADVPYVPTPAAVVDAMLEMAGVRAGDRLVDLGSGDGRVVIAAVSRHGATGLGIELDPELVQRARAAAAAAALGERARFVQADIFRADFGDPTVVTLYLLPGVNLRLRPRLLALRPGTRIVSHDFGLGDWAADRSLRLPVPEKSYGPPHSDVYLWIVPARVEGVWRWTIDTPQGSQPAELTLRQHHQRLTGSMRVGNREALLVNARLRGDRLSFAVVDDDLPRHDYEARARGELLDGRLRIAGEKAARRWSAERVPAAGAER